jgi:hypothetical protein
MTDSNSESLTDNSSSDNDSDSDLTGTSELAQPLDVKTTEVSKFLQNG